MVRYLTLIEFTDQGLEKVSESTRRAAQFRSAIENAGGSVIGMYWAVGEADGAIIFEAPDEATAATLLLGLGRKGFVRTRTMRLFDGPEFEKIAAKA